MKTYFYYIIIFISALVAGIHIGKEWANKPEPVFIVCAPDKGHSYFKTESEALKEVNKFIKSGSDVTFTVLPGQ